MSTETFTTSDNWVCPAKVYSIDVECWGGGGGGAGENSVNGGGGGGGGAYSKKTIPVNPGTSYTVTVGVGGQGGNEGTEGGNGGDSWFSSDATVLVKGGQGGQLNNNTAAGGATASGIGDTKFSGGTGGAGGSMNGGGGGGGGGTTANGGNGGTGNGGSAVGGTGGTANGGNGGAGSATYHDDGSPGSVRGGGGGGGGDACNDNTLGDGGRGEIIITYVFSELYSSIVNLLALGIMNSRPISYTELDYMEYSSNASAQAAYVTDAGISEVVDQQQTTKGGAGGTFGDSGGTDYTCAQSFKLSGNKTVTAVEIGQYLKTGSPTGNWTLRIETDNANKPSGTLADANASVVVTPPADGATVKGTFATSFVLTGATLYWLVVALDNQTTDNCWTASSITPSGYADGSLAQQNKSTSVWSVYSTYSAEFKIYVQGDKYLQSYSESTIKTQGSYALKGIAVITDSLNKTLTRTVSPTIDLIGKKTIKYDIYSSRTGSNISLNIHDSGGVTSSTVAIVVASNTWETKSWDISGVADANKDVIDQFYPKITNADAANTFYVDNIRYR